MPRLIDDIRAGGRFEMPWFVQPHKIPAWEGYAQHVSDILNHPALPVLLIDNVADYYFRSSDQENWDLVRDFPNLAPPFPQFWLEHRMPSTIHSREKGDTDVSRLIQGGRVGMLVTSLDPKQEVHGEGIPDNARWILWAELFIDYGRRDHLAQGPHGATFFALDERGVLLERPWMQTYCAVEHNETIKNYITWFHPALLAVSFLHCKNVTIQDEVVAKPLAKKYHARTGNWPTKYKTLVIEPLKQILRTQGRSDELGIQRAMHICRGHFADYTDGKGLFGKYHGRFWIPATVRGTKREGAQPAREIEVRV